MNVEQLLQHAKRFGTEGVMETGAEVGLSFESLVKLQKGLDKIEETADARRRFSTWKKPRKSAEDRVKRLLGIEEEEEAV